MTAMNTAVHGSRLERQADELKELSYSIHVMMSLIEDDATRKACEGESPFLDEYRLGGLAVGAKGMAVRIASLAEDIEEAAPRIGSELRSSDGVSRGMVSRAVGRQAALIEKLRHRLKGNAEELAEQEGVLDSIGLVTDELLSASSRAGGRAPHAGAAPSGEAR